MVPRQSWIRLKKLLFRPPLMVFLWVSYLAKRPRPDFNNGSGDKSNCGCILGHWHLLEFDLNNDPSPGHSSLGSDGSTSSVHLNLWSPKILIIHLMSAISGPRLDFNNCPWDNLNNSHILTQRRLFVSDSNNGPSPGLCNLGQMKDTPVQVSHLRSPGGWPRDNLNNGCILAPSVYSGLHRFMASHQAIRILEQFLERGRRLPQLALSPPC